jgi:hypothetical protein
MFAADYFSMDHILAEEPRVYSTFLVDGYLLGHLDPLGQGADDADKENSPNAGNVLPESSPTETGSTTAATTTPSSASSASSSRNLRAGRRVALPFWLAETLAARGAVEVRLPRCYGPHARNDLLADARSVSLYKACHFYYALGLALARLLGDAELVAMLLRAFSERCWPAVDAAVYGSAMHRGSASMHRLDVMERDLFFASHGMAVAVTRWKERTTDKIVGASATRLGKRASGTAGFAEASPVTPRPRLR